MNTFEIAKESFSTVFGNAIAILTVLLIAPVSSVTVAISSSKSNPLLHILIILLGGPFIVVFLLAVLGAMLVVNLLFLPVWIVTNLLAASVWKAS